MTTTTPNYTDSLFNLHTPLFHPDLDNWGLSYGTCVWMASGTEYKPVEEVRAGDRVLGIGFRREIDYVPVGTGHKPIEIERPILVERTVLLVRRVRARSWEMTFGAYDRASEDRRLVAGALTCVTLGPCPIHFDPQPCPLVDLQTTLPNPRRGQGRRENVVLDREASATAGRPVYREGPLAGDPRGDMIMVIPGEAWAGQTGAIDAQTKDYHRYAGKVVRQFAVAEAESDLYQILVTPDTHVDERGRRVVDRCNLICQTPFEDEVRVRKVGVDPLSKMRLESRSMEEVQQRWNEYVTLTKDKADPAVETGEIKVRAQAQHYAALEGELAEKLQDRYDLRGGWLNGGILVALPVDLGVMRAYWDMKAQATDA